MSSKNIMKGVFLAFCIIGMLVLPAAAAPTGQGTTGKTSAIDQGLKDDLWNNHHQYRLQEFDTHVERANSVIGILNKYSIDTSRMQSTLATISDKRTSLDTALTNKDKESLKTINADLLSLWKQFGREMKDSIRAHYTAARAAVNVSATGSGALS